MRTIIIATDFSEVAQNAAHYAAALAQKVGAQLLIYHAYLYPNPPVDLPGFRKRFEEAYSKDQSRAESLRNDLKAAYGITINYLLDQEPILEKLPKLVTQHNAELVVVGIRGINSFYRNFFGSTTISILKIAKFPVLVVPEDIKFKSIENILFAYLPQVLQPENELLLLKILTKAFGSNVHVIKIGLPERQSKQAYEETPEASLKGELGDFNFKFLKIEADSFLNGITLGVKETNADLLVTVPGQHELWEDFIKNSNTRKIAEHVQIPLLTIPN